MRVSILADETIEGAIRYRERIEGLILRTDTDESAYIENPVNGWYRVTIITDEPGRVARDLEDEGFDLIGMTVTK